MMLNAKKVDTAKGKEKTYKLSDGGGLYLQVEPNGSRYWRLKYRFGGKEKRLSFGVYPTVTLAEARQKRDEAKKILAAGDDPGEVKKAKKRASESAGMVLNPFKEVALEWHRLKSPKWSAGYASDIMEAFEKDIFPHIGLRPIADIKPLELLEVLRLIEARGAMEKAKKVRQRCGEVFRYAIVTGRAVYNPAPDLASAMQGYESVHYPFLRANELPEFFSALKSYTGSPIVLTGAYLLILTGLRTGELRAAEWREIDFDNSLWEIPKERMKMRRAHLVPLSEQALEHLKKLKALTGAFPLIFPGRNDHNKCMSEASINQIFKRIGYGGRVTGHGFRHTMSTILHEQGFESAWVETQLAHTDKNSIRGIYNHAQYIDGRRKMMQWYADYLDSFMGIV
ncbi:tyrosine-type recombinase/integrase [Cronobacter sakazakii]|nr:integrase [Cronobacter sakazakii]EGT4368905.1 integrase [Cronobacter sakazakii]EMA8649957.1 tyrosine-type recombinase/integrase [Cronobacter sakazakii]EME2027547.1 tyrosine-type recombinase/integrase [Cronobacter sakazakii]EME2065782.1 tyrosine-type recombinase/integrase [Cronobacter sakazakii]